MTKTHKFKRDCGGVQLEFHVVEHETECKITAVLHKREDISHLMSYDVIEAAENEFHYKLINHAI